MDSESVSIAPSSDIDSDGLTKLHNLHHNTAKPAVPIASFDKPKFDEDRISSSDSSLPSSPPTPQVGQDIHVGSGQKRRPRMPFSSSPVLYPASSSPPPPPQQPTKKRKLFQTLDLGPVNKRTKVVEHVSQGIAIKAKNFEPQLPDVNVCPDPALPLLAGVTQCIADIDDLLENDDDHADSTRQERTALPTNGNDPLIGLRAQTSSGSAFSLRPRPVSEKQTYEEIIAQRSVTAAGRAHKAYYGIQIQDLVREAKTQRELNLAQAEFEQQQAALEPQLPPKSGNPATSMATSKPSDHQMWTEKYRATKFTELVGDERTHRSVLRWLKGWDEIVFPAKGRTRGKRIFDNKDDTEHQQRKILLLTGPPGLGKTTLAHVCAKKAGYETLEINASDDRSRDVVRGRIKDILGTETVRGIKESGKERKAGRPVCVIVDEVDGVTTGSGAGGEGGFMKALIDLIHLDQHNSNNTGKQLNGNRKRKGDRFRMLRPLILVCNDVYAPSLRPLRGSSLAEIVHVRKPGLDKVISRLKTVFDRENILCDNDAVRRICESAWGMGTRKQNSLGGRGAGEGDLRGILVQAEWMAHKFRSKAGADASSRPRLTRKWVESQVGEAQSTSGHKGLGRGGTREVVDRVFVEGAGLPNLPTALTADEARLVAESKTTALGVADIRKRAAITALRQMVDTCGEHDRLMTDCFTAYPSQVFQDDTQLSKPNAAYDWLHFHDRLSSKLYGGQEWELGAYMNTSACAFHDLFAVVDKGDKSWNDEKRDEEQVAAHPFSGARADFVAYEATKQNTTLLTELQASFSAPLLRIFSSVDNMAIELIPNVNRMLAPDVKPVVIGGSSGSASVASVRKDSEKSCVQNAVRVMSALNLRFDKIKVEVDNAAGPGARAGFIYRMEPPLDTLTAFTLDKSAASSGLPPTRYAVRQVLDQELRKEKILQNSMARQSRSGIIATPGGKEDEDKENKDPKMVVPNKASGAKRDFFGRIIADTRPNSTAQDLQVKIKESAKEGDRVWVSFHEGFSNAVRKPITLKELMDSF